MPVKLDHRNNLSTYPDLPLSMEWAGYFLERGQLFYRVGDVQVVMPPDSLPGLIAQFGGAVGVVGGVVGVVGGASDVRA